MEPRRMLTSDIHASLAGRNEPTFFPVLLDIRHPGIRWPSGDTQQDDGHLRLINDTRGVRFKGDDAVAKYYAPCMFKLKMPKEDGKKKVSASASVSAADGRMIEVIRSIDEDLTCRIVALFAKVKGESGGDAYTFVSMYGKEFYMGSVSWDGVTAKWTLDPDRIMDLNIPRDKGSRFRFPSMAKG